MSSVREKAEARLLRFTAHVRRQFRRWKDSESQTWERAKAFALQLGHDELTSEQYADEWALRGIVR